jgi:hypothetical protein
MSRYSVALHIQRLGMQGVFSLPRTYVAGNAKAAVKKALGGFEHMGSALVVQDDGVPVTGADHQDTLLHRLYQIERQLRDMVDTTPATANNPLRDCLDGVSEAIELAKAAADQFLYEHKLEAVLQMTSRGMPPFEAWRYAEIMCQDQDYASDQLDVDLSD